MLPTLHEIEQAAIGCWRLVRKDPAGLQRFDLSLDGFWRSFRWAFVLAVLDAGDALLGRMGATADPDAGTPAAVIWPLVVSALASLITFCLFPVVVGLLAKPMALTTRYAPYVIVRNWLTVFLSCPVYVIDLLTAFDLMPDGFREVVVIGVVVATLTAGSVIAHVVLGTTRTVSFGFALLDFLLALFIGEAASRLMS